jgi:L-aspartate oxidase
MGGVRTDLDGKTSIEGLFAAGEVACTGVHGANRLASNSLLEGFVYGARAGKGAVKYAEKIKERDTDKTPYNKHVTAAEEQSVTAFDADKTKSSLRQLMWNKVGIIRCEKSLRSAKNRLNKKDFILKETFNNRKEAELKNMLTVAGLITGAALFRKGSVGAHYRSDFTERGENWRKHTVCVKGEKTGWID